MGIILLLEVITGAVAVYFRNTLEEQSSTEYRSRLNETIRNYRLNPDDSSYDETNNNALDTLQNTVSCFSYLETMILLYIMIAGMLRY